MPPPLPDVPGVTHHYATVNGMRLHYAEAGEGEPLVLVHGWPQHWWMWRAFIPRLAQSFRVIAPDLRGHGWSAKPAGGSYLKDDMLADVLALIDELGLDRVRYAGHDWGGYVGMLAGLEHPERIERLMVLSIPHPWRRIDPLSAAAVAAYQPIVGGPAGKIAMQRLGFARLVLQAGRSIGSFTRAEIDEYDSVQRDGDTASASVQIYRQFMLREMPALVRGRFARARLTVPTRWIVGGKDIVARSDERWREHADDMTFERIEAANHFLPEELPQTVLDRMLAFF